MTYGGVFGNGAGTLTANMAGTGGSKSLKCASPSPGPFVISSGTVLLNGSLAGPIADNSVLSLNNAGAQSLAVPVSGSGTVVKNGAGRLTVSGNQSNSGGLAVSGGTVYANSIFSGDAVTVGAGATLSGSGSVSSGVTVNNGGIVGNIAGGS